MKQCIHETRLQYLLRVAISHIREHAADKETEYDESSCDGSCLADELQNEYDDLIEHEARQGRIAEAMGYSKPCTKEEHAIPRKQPAPEAVPLELCPKCQRHLDSEPEHMTRGHRVSCRRCDIHATDTTVEEACRRLHRRFGPKPADGPPCLCETAFTPECPVHSVSIHTAADAPLSCGPNCKHTPEEHQAFDIGVDMAERDPNAENPCRKFTNPREDLIEAWEAGASVGRKNREDVEGGPAYS